jgi:outer membrane protein
MGGKCRICRRCSFLWLFFLSVAVVFFGCTSPVHKVPENELRQRIAPAAPAPRNVPEKKPQDVPSSGLTSPVHVDSAIESKRTEPVKDPQLEPGRLSAPLPPSGILSLDQSILYAKRHNPRLRVLRERVKQARAGKQIAFSAFLPEAVFSYRALWGSDKFALPTVPSLVGNVAYGETADNFRSAELNVQWVLWDFGQTPGRYEQARAAWDIAELQYDRGIQTVAFNATSGYFNLLQKKAIRRVAGESVRRAGSLLKDAQNFHTQGTAVRNDVLQAEVLLAEMQLVLVRTRTAEMIALAGLNRVMGVHVSSHMEIADVTARPTFSRSLESCLRQAVEFRDEFRSVLKAISSSQWGLAASKARFLPRIIAGGTGARHGGQTSSDTYLLTGGIKIELPLFEGTKRYGDLEQRKAEVQETMARAEEVADGIAFEVIVAYAGILETKESISYAQTAVARGKENLKVLRHMFDQGDATATDVIDAEWALLRAQEAYYRSLYQYRTALAQLDYAVGAPAGESSSADSQAG